jgi:xanthine dehydrogenase accessory factor
VLASDLGQCCGGVVELWMERYTWADRAVLRTACDATGHDAAVLISTISAHGINHRIVSACGYSPEADLLLRTPRASALPRVIGGAGTDRGGASLLERLDEALPAVWLYGAGHVGQALVRIAAELPLRLTWIDTRPGSFPAQVPDEVRIVHTPDPLPGVASAGAGTRFLVLTHSHALDYALCRAILQRGDFASLGLIGSNSKAARFRSRLARDGVPADAIARLRCPIGADGIASKWPAAIALAIAFELLGAIGADSVGRQVPGPQPADAGCAAASCANCGAPDHSC